MLARYLPYVLAALSGGLLVFAYAPFNLWIVAPIAVITAFRQWRNHPDKALLIGWLFGLGWFGAGISWVHVSIAQFGGLPLIVSIALMAVLSAYLALFPGIALWLTSKYAAPAFWPISLAAIWFVMEFIRSWLLSGFPWLSLGYTQLNSPLNGWIPVIGETGVTALFVLLCAIFALWNTKRNWHYQLTIVTTCIVSGWILNRVSWTEPHTSHTVSLVQGNIEQSIRWVPEQDLPTLQKYQALTELVWESDIIVWPEAAIPTLESRSQPFLAQLDIEAIQNKAALITGIVNYNFETEEAYNNLLVLGQYQASDIHGHYRYFHNNRYAKHHLLPIGEFVPLESLIRPLAPLFDLPMSSFSRGDNVQPNLVAKGANIAPAICFEIAFPRQLSSNLKHDTDMILTVSNDAWFGHSHGPDQHLQIAQMRAKEFGLPVIRSTNNGVTAVINHKGKIQSQLPQFEAATLTDKVQATRGNTPYRLLGDIPMWMLVMLIGIFVYLRQRKN